MSIDDIIAALTVDEKSALTHGADLWACVHRDDRRTERRARAHRPGAHVRAVDVLSVRVGGRYRVHVGRSSAVIDHIIEIDVVDSHRADTADR